MIKTLSYLGTNQRLGLLALALGALAMFSTAVPRASLDTRQTTSAIERGSDLVQPRQLADWILKGRADYRLVDLRDADAFAEYRIPSAENLAAAAVSDGSIARTEKLILCSEDGTRAGQAWGVLKAQGFTNVSVLAGGVDGWKREVLFPALTEGATPADQRENERLKQVSAYFGGAPRVGGSGTLAPALPASMPRVERPATPSGGPKPGAPKKKEGC